MSDPKTITTATRSGVAKGDILTVSTGRGQAKNYRIVDVPTETRLIVDRPWWLPLALAWGWFTGPVRRLRWRLKDWYLRTFAE